jgi:hypothetical protein
MNKRLAQLISDYQISVSTALRLLQKSGIVLPISGRDWAEADIPACGELEGGIAYYKHGYGCAVSLPAGEIDFDFGDRGEIDGFDLWRLNLFAGSKFTEYGFDTKAALEESFNAAVKTGSLVYSGYSLYYVADSVNKLLLPFESLKILRNGSLPHERRDSVLLLYATCYLPADLMRENYLKLDRKLKTNNFLSQNDQVKFRIYLSSWLGYLHETSEGFKKLNMRLLLENKRPEDFRELLSKSDAIGTLRKLHLHELRSLRNSVFHLRDDSMAIDTFFANDAKRVVWASELHMAIAEFLSEYRILCEVHYLVHGRLGESQIRRDRLKRRRTIATQTFGDP